MVKTHKKVRKSNRRTKRRGGKNDWFSKHSDVGLATFDFFLGGKRRRYKGGNNEDDVKDLDIAMSEFDLFDDNVQNASKQDDFANMSMISRESDEQPNLNESINVFDDDDDEVVPENSIPFDESEWMNFDLDEGFIDNEDDNRSDLNETTRESISFGGKKTKKRKAKRRRRITMRKRTKKYNNRRSRNIKRIKIGGNVDRQGSSDFNPNLAFDKKQMGGQNVGGNCSDPNFSIYNTPMLKLFPYRA